MATSDDPEASDRIARFAAGREPWIVAVRMVSEGVDIPRLRVGVFATTTTTELFFRQAVGRLVRWTRGLGPQTSFLYIPDEARLRARASPSQSSGATRCAGTTARRASDRRRSPGAPTG